MNKKGVTWSTIIYAIIAIVVLLVIVWIFREQVNEISKSLMNLIKTTTAGSEDVGKGLKDLIERK